MTRHNVGQLDEFKAIADRFDAQLRITRLRPSGRGADVWDELHPTAAQQRELYDWLRRARRERADRRLVLPPRRLRRRAARAEPVRRGPGGLPDRSGRRRVRLPVRDPRELPGRQRPRRRAGSPGCGASRSCSPSCAARRRGGACTVVLGVRRLPRRVHGGEVLHRPAAGRPGPRMRQGPRRTRADSADRAGTAPKPSLDHSHRTAHRCRSRYVGRPSAAVPDRACDENPLAELVRAVAERCMPSAGRPRLASQVARARGRGAVLAVPLGSTEQHGPHLPLSTDTDIARRAVRSGSRGRAAGRRGRAARCRTGRAASTPGSPGTLSIGQAALRAARRRAGAARPRDTFARVAARVGARRQRRTGRPARSRGCAPSPATSGCSSRAGTATRTPAAPRPRCSSPRPRPGATWSAPSPATPGRCASCCRSCAPAACARSPRPACSATRPARPRRGRGAARPRWPPT